MNKICVVTGSRAEYGIMKPLIKKLVEVDNLHVDIIATAMHLEEKYGYTYRQIEEDGFSIAKKIPLQLEDTSRSTLARSLAILTKELGEFFDSHAYDLILILGDRYEMLPVANIAMLYHIPICHIHGGEKTLGNFDESIRHALTKMSHLHLVSTEEFKNRVIQLGEQPSEVHNIGAMGVENVLAQDFLTSSELEERLSIQLESDYYVVLYHPVTLEGNTREQMEELVAALGQTTKQLLFIGSNSDTDSDNIMGVIHDYVANHSNAHVFASLSTQEYHSLVKLSQGLVGNSSSGLIEVPSLGVPTLNIGNRQLGRLAGPSVIHVNSKQEEILAGLKKMELVTDFENPYEKSQSSERAKQIIIDFLERKPSIVKEFYDWK